MSILPKKEFMPSIYQVAVKQHEDWHFATCKALPGLFVGHKEYDTVLKNIPESIAMLIKHDTDRDVLVTETKPTEPTLLGNKTYIVTNKKACYGNTVSSGNGSASSASGSGTGSSTTGPTQGHRKVVDRRKVVV